MCLVYGLNYLDKTTLSYASIMGLRLPPSDNKLASGIGLTGSDYQWLGSMFYFGYIAWEYPTTRLLQVLAYIRWNEPWLTSDSGFQHYYVGYCTVLFRSSRKR
jgi:hypothetical protein